MRERERDYAEFRRRTVAFALLGKSLLIEWVLPPARGSFLACLHCLFIFTLSISSSFSWLSLHANDSKQIIQRLVGIFFDQLDHALEIVSIIDQSLDSEDIHQA